MPWTETAWSHSKGSVGLLVRLWFEGAIKMGASTLNSGTVAWIWAEWEAGFSKAKTGRVKIAGKRRVKTRMVRQRGRLGIKTSIYKRGGECLIPLC